MSETKASFPDTLQGVIAYLADPDRCFAAAVALRWPDGKITCPRCDSDKHSFVSTRRIWFCKNCKRQFTLKVGTIFEDSPLGMDKWMAAMWLLVNCKNGISSCEVAKDIGITQKSAWFMVHRLRLALREGSFMKLSGEVEVDETFIGGKARNMHVAQRQRRITGTGSTDKVAVMGIVKRGGEVRAMVVDDRRKATLQTEVKRHVQAGAALYTDELLSYDGLASEYAHQVVNHAVAYVDGVVHTNTLENFWSLLKRGLHGTYVSVEPYHLHRYLDEQAFRYNTRKETTDGERFIEAMKGATGRRVTWKMLTGKEQSNGQLN
jgi:transposase-like protein